MGFLTKIENSVEEPAIKSKEELRRHNAAVIENYIKTLEISEKKFLNITQNDITNEHLELELEYNEPPQNDFIFNKDIKVPEINVPVIEVTEKSDKKRPSAKDLTEDELMQLFEKETGKNAIWRGKITKNYLIWRDEIDKEEK